MVEIAAICCYIALAALALVWDVRRQRIPNQLTIAGLVAGLAMRALPGGEPLLDGLAAVAIALAIGLPLFALGAIGGGDAKLLAALSAFAGLGQLRPALLAAALLGGVLAVALTVRRGVIVPALLNARSLGKYILTAGRRGTRPRLESPGSIRVPYGVAISLGFMAARFLPLTRWM